MKKLIESIDAARPENPGTRYAMGYDDGLKKAKKIIQKSWCCFTGTSQSSHGRKRYCNWTT